jgi:hypothetical protein
MTLPRGPLISAGPAASSHSGQAHSTSPVASVRRRVSARMRELDCLLFRLHLESLIIRIQTSTFINIQRIEFRFGLYQTCKTSIEAGLRTEIVAPQNHPDMVRDSPQMPQGHVGVQKSDTFDRVLTFPL